MCGLAEKLLAEKLVDDFYDYDHQEGNPSPTTDGLLQQLKTLVPLEQHELLYQWEAQCSESCGEELRRFADFMAKNLLECRFDGRLAGVLLDSCRIDGR